MDSRQTSINTFWPLFSDKLLLVYNYAFESGCLSVSRRRGIISLVFKKGERSLLKNWRPTTLLTTDYKMLTKALANRLQRVLPLIFHTDQTASVKGRTINDNVRLLHDVIYYANYCDIPLALRLRLRLRLRPSTFDLRPGFTWLFVHYFRRFWFWPGFYSVDTGALQLFF